MANETEMLNIGDVEWESYRFKEIEEDDLFWFNKNLRPQNKPIRKSSDTTALILSSQQEIQVDPNLMVYQKES